MRYVLDFLQQKKELEIIAEIKDSSLIESSVPIEKVFQYVFEVTPPIAEDEFISMNDGRLSKIVLHDEYGMTGAHSIKPGNIMINFKKVIETTIETGVSAAGSAGHPYLMIMTGLLGLRKLLGLKKIELKETHAMVITFLWDLNNNNKLQISNIDLLNEINEHFEKLGKQRLDNIEFNRVLSELDELRSIKLSPNGTIDLIEKVTLNY